MTADTIAFPSLEWFEALREMVNDDPGYRQFGTVDAQMGVKVADGVYIVAFRCIPVQLGACGY